MKEKLFSVTKKDFRFDYFRCPGNGGQKGDKTDSGVRITHIETGIAYVCTETRFQHKNKEIAFKKLVKDKKFLFWLKQKANNTLDIDRLVEEDMKDSNLKVEVRKNNKWEKENE